MSLEEKVSASEIQEKTSRGNAEPLHLGIRDVVRIGGYPAKIQYRYIEKEAEGKNADKKISYFAKLKYTLASITAGLANIAFFYYAPVNWAAIPLMKYLAPLFKVYFKYVKLPVLAARSVYVAVKKEPIGKIAPSLTKIISMPFKAMYAGYYSLFTGRKLKAEYDLPS